VNPVKREQTISFEVKCVNLDAYRTVIGFTRNSQMSGDDGSIAQLHATIQREDFLESFLLDHQAQQTKELTSVIEQISLAQKFAFFLHMFLRQPHFTSSILVQSLVANPERTNFVDSNGRMTMTSLKTLQNGRSKFADSICLFALHHPECIDALTFSFLPSFFGLLLSAHSQRSFLHFLREVFERNRDFGLQFARIISAFASVQIMVEHVSELVGIEYNLIHTQETSDRFLDKFLLLCANFIWELPPIFFILLELPNSNEIFEIAFFTEIFANPQLFGFIAVADCQDQSSSIAILMAASMRRLDAVTRFRDLLSSFKVPSFDAFGDAAALIPVIGQTFVFTRFDLSILNAAHLKIEGKVIVEKFDWSIVRSTSLSCSRLCDSPTSGTLMRRYLAGICSVPPSIKSLGELVESGIHNCPSSSAMRQRILYSLCNSKTIQISPPEGKSEVARFARICRDVNCFYRSIATMVRIRRFTLQAELINAFLRCVPGKSTGTIKSEFETLCPLLSKFCRNRDFGVDPEPALLLFSMLPAYSYSDLIRDFPGLVAADKCFRARVGTIAVEDVDPRLTALKEEQNVNFLRTAEILRNGFECESAIYGLQLLRKAVQVLRDALVEAGFDEIGEDVVTAGLMFLVFDTIPGNFISKTNYFLRSLYPFRLSFRAGEYRDSMMHDIYRLDLIVRYFISRLDKEEVVEITGYDNFEAL
jgi:hypothetical protein